MTSESQWKVVQALNTTVKTLLFWEITLLFHTTFIKDKTIYSNV